MSNEYNFPSYELPVNPAWEQGRVAHGFVTPSQDRIPQVMSIPPRRVLPIIFLPGIMGSNLRMSAERQAQMGRDNNISWRPDSLAQAKILVRGSPAMRQDQLDPNETEVDEYDPVSNPTGNVVEGADQRHDIVQVKLSYALDVRINTPLLMDDPATAKPRKTKDQKARERGWGEVFFKSYQDVLELCERRLNTAFFGGNLDKWWKSIVDVPPGNWEANRQPALQPLDEATLKKAVNNCWFPVHAMGYNWLQSNRNSGIRVAERINALMKSYQDQGFQCEKVIVMTHSMGGGWSQGR